LTPEGFTVERLDHLVLSVESLEASARFYETICGMRRITFDGGRIAMVFGAHKLNLNERAPDAPPSPPLDFCLTTNRTAEEVVAHVRSHGIRELLGPVPRSGALGPMLSVYVLDPDRNIVELASYLRV
jgi:catechol 2,3-dioxygenase-like lactoylglutathione lyase family enzyme